MTWYTTADARRDAAARSESLMKRCQAGCNNLNDANNLLAECYGHMGRLTSNNADLRAERDRLRAELERLKAPTVPTCEACGDGTGEPCDHADCSSGRHRH